MSAILRWLADSAPVPHWLICVGALALFCGAVILGAGVWLWWESAVFAERDHF